MKPSPIRLHTLAHWQQRAVQGAVYKYSMSVIGNDGICRAELVGLLCEWADAHGLHVCDALTILRDLESSGTVERCD